MADSREAERQRKLNKKPSVKEAGAKIEAKRKKAVEANKKAKAAPKKESRPNKERNPFNVRSAEQNIRDRRYQNQTTDSNNK